jgi:GAF domain-containing protein
MRAQEDLTKRTVQEQTLKEQLANVEAESRRFSERFAHVEQENSNLANLYVASYRLHGTVERREVLEILEEIATYLIGSEEVAIFEVDGPDGRLGLISSTGIDATPFRQIPAGHGVIGRSVSLGETWIAADDTTAERRREEANLSACIPLKLNGKVTGAIALFRLLPQKTNGIEAMDRELFELLATHAAVALYCSGLHARLTAQVSPA